MLKMEGWRSSGLDRVVGPRRPKTDMGISTKGIENHRSLHWLSKAPQDVGEVSDGKRRGKEDSLKQTLMGWLHPRSLIWGILSGRESFHA